MERRINNLIDQKNNQGEGALDNYRKTVIIIVTSIIEKNMHFERHETKGGKMKTYQRETGGDP